MKNIPTLMIYACCCIRAFAQDFSQAASLPDAPSPKREVRAVWLATVERLDWPGTYATGAHSAEVQRRELAEILDKLQRGGVNTVLFQARLRATTIYPSAFEPFDACLTGEVGMSPGYDPLRFAVEECHRRGMELHAWVVTIPVGKWNSEGCRRLRRKYPSLVKRVGDEGCLNPEDPKTADLLADICAEITRNYDVDGIHLDYIRYPEKWNLKVTKDRGRRNVTDIVRRISMRVKSLKPWVKMSCSPVGKYADLPRQSSGGWNAYSRVMQEAQAWLREGLMDELFPMLYFRDNNFFPFALDWQEKSSGRIVAPGLALWFMEPREQNWSLQTITQEMEVCRQWGMGHTYFRSKFFTGNLKGIYDFASRQFDIVPALVPAMTWQHRQAPLPPTEVSTDSLASSLTWSGAVDRSDAPYLLYNVYASREWPVDTEDSRNLVAARVRQTSLLVPLDGHFYAVRAMDRYGNESEAVQNVRLRARREPDPEALSVGTEEPICEKPELLPLMSCDGNTLLLGGAPMNRSDLLQLETMQGTVVKTVFAARRVDVRDLPGGFYLVRSIGKKKSRHRLGYFRVKREARK